MRSSCSLFRDFARRPIFKTAGPLSDQISSQFTVMKTRSQTSFALSQYHQLKKMESASKPKTTSVNMAAANGKPHSNSASAVSAAKAESSMISLVYKIAMVCLIEGLKLLSGGEEPQRQLTRETIELNQRRRHLRSQSMHKIERDAKSVVEIKKNADVVIVRSASKTATSTVRVSRSLLRLQMERKARERQALLAARPTNGSGSASGGVPVRRSVSSPAGSTGLRSFSGSRSFLSVPKSRRLGRKNSAGSLRNSFSSSLESVREETQADLRSIQ